MYLLTPTISSIGDFLLATLILILVEPSSFTPPLLRRPESICWLTGNLARVGGVPVEAALVHTTPVVLATVTGRLIPAVTWGVLWSGDRLLVKEEVIIRATESCHLVRASLVGGAKNASHTSDPSSSSPVCFAHLSRSQGRDAPQVLRLVSRLAGWWRGWLGHGQYRSV
uniref:Uncharacterized protein n=1 Tax=Cacopsylla melanoneura TaxID=428564 RepID=A0A8D8SVR2_9HEMI